MTSQGVVVLTRGDQSLDSCPDRVYHFGFERAHDDASTGWGCCFALGMKPEIIPQLVDLPTYPRTLFSHTRGGGPWSVPDRQALLVTDESSTVHAHVSPFVY